MNSSARGSFLCASSVARAQSGSEAYVSCRSTKNAVLYDSSRHVTSSSRYDSAFALIPHHPSRLPVAFGASRAGVHSSRSAIAANTSCTLTKPQCRYGDSPLLLGSSASFRRVAYVSSLRSMKPASTRRAFSCPPPNDTTGTPWSIGSAASARSAARGSSPLSRSAGDGAGHRARSDFNHAAVSALGCTSARAARSGAATGTCSS